MLQGGKTRRELLELDQVLLTDDCVGDGARKVVGDLRDGNVAVLENLRFHEGERDNNEDFAKELAKLLKSFEPGAGDPRRKRGDATRQCPDCGMTYAEFRQQGRFGCPRDYEVFKDQLTPLLLRIHNRTRHVGAPEPEPTGEREHLLSELQAKLEQAIQAEAYESAAQLRDEIEKIESKPE